MIDSVTTKLKAKEAALVADNYVDLADTIMTIAQKRHDIDDRQKAESAEVVSRVPALSRIAYYASVFLESQLFIAQERDSV